MAMFFNKFPRIQYTLSGKKYAEYQTITNLLFRTAVVREILYNTSSYIKYVIRDGDTPETLATKVYDSPEAHWLILYANEMIDPQYDWPLTSPVFSRYMVDKYRAMAEEDVGNPLQDFEVLSWTQDRTNDASVHHYEKVIKQYNQTTQITNETRYIINKTRLTDNALDVPHDYYDSLPDEQSVTPINTVIKGQTVIETVYRDFVTYFDYEERLNEQKRNIRIVKKEYYPLILAEFDALTNTPEITFLRRVS